MYLRLSSSGSRAATGVPMFTRAGVFSGTVRWPSSEDGKVAGSFSANTRAAVTASAVLPPPRLSVYLTLARRNEPASDRNVV